MLLHCFYSYTMFHLFTYSYIIYWYASIYTVTLYDIICAPKERSSLETKHIFSVQRDFKQKQAMVRHKLLFPETHIAPRKWMVGRLVYLVSCWVSAHFQVQNVSFREGTQHEKLTDSSNTRPGLDSYTVPNVHRSASGLSSDGTLGWGVEDEGNSLQTWYRNTSESKYISIYLQI